MGKNDPKVVYECSECGNQETKWMGRCPQCGEWNTLEEKTIMPKGQGDANAKSAGQKAQVRSLASVDTAKFSRINTGSEEFDLVLGGGLIPGQAILFSGEPGIGKSTLLLQTVVNLTGLQEMQTLYVSAEESEVQVASRASRLFPKGGYEDVKFTSATDLYTISEEIKSGGYNLVVLDSIQTVQNPEYKSLPGSLSQIKSCSSHLIDLAKAHNIILVLVGHINKEGNIAGPKVLEHLVDSVLQLEGERSGEYRLLRTLKNRFGPTGEVGLFAMGETGLHDMHQVGSLLNGTQEPAVGTAKTVSLEGNRTIVIEVQALTNDTVFAYPKRVAEGVSVSRLQLICAILDRFANAKLGSKDVYIRTAGGYKLQTPAADLAIAAAILSSLKKQELQPDTAYTGELSLSGKIYLSENLAKKLKNIQKYGINHIVSPQIPKKLIKQFPVGVKSVGSLGKLLS